MTDDWISFMPKEYTEELINEIKNNPQACNLDEIPNCVGEFGLEKTNPIPTYGIPSIQTYLYSLRTLNGKILRYRRNGALNVKNIEKPVDEYEIYDLEGEIIAYLYFSAYHWKTSSKVPIGFFMNGFSINLRNKISNPAITFNQTSAYFEYQKNLRNLDEIDELRKRKQKEQEKTRLAGKKKNEKRNYKNDWEMFKNILEENNIHTLYHFTERKNLKSIKNQSALYSWHYCIKNNIEIPVPGGNQLSRELDTRKGLENYVRASFTRNHPMMYVAPIRNRNNVILEIDPEVIYWIGTKYANKNATRNDVSVGLTLNDFMKLRFDILKLPNHFNLNDIDKPYYQGEILVPTKIPSEFIRNLDELLNNERKP